jgi:hypothetical protein
VCIEQTTFQGCVKLLFCQLYSEVYLKYTQCKTNSF